MANNFEDAMSKRTDKELVKILTVSADEYQSAALEAAKREFTKRNLSENQLAMAQQAIEQDQKQRAARAAEPLDEVWKLLTFIFPGVLQIIFSGTFKADGYDRKAKELVRWTTYGFGFYAALVVLFFIAMAIINRFYS
jgi:uncharacterized membrane protein (DUF106 family)